MTNLVPLNQRAITVSDDTDGKLRSFRWYGERYIVANVASRWRIDDGWWVVREWREYCLVITRERKLVLLYRNLLTNRWFFERTYN